MAPEQIGVVTRFLLKDTFFGLEEADQSP
jgi:hypothetical protein